MRALMGLVIFLLIVFLVWLAIRWAHAPVASQRAEEQDIEAKRADAKWQVVVSPDQHGSAMVCAVRQAVLDSGRVFDYEAVPVVTVEYNDPSYDEALGQALETAQRRCRALNARYDTSPGEL